LALISQSPCCKRLSEGMKHAKFTYTLADMDC
jgi:hypothetical protein